MSRGSRIRDTEYSRDDRRSRVSSEMNSLASRIYVGNINTKNFAHRDIYDWMNKYGKVIDVAFFDRHILVQFDRENDARRAVDREKGQSYRGSRGDIRFASTSDGSMDARSDIPRSRSPRQLPYERDSRDMSPYRESARERSPSERDRYYKAQHTGETMKISNEPERLNNRHDSPEYNRKYDRPRNVLEESRPRSNSRPEYPVIPKDVQEPKWNSPPFTDKIGTDRPGFDAAIIVMSSELLNYAETIESRLQRQIALTTHIIVLKEESHSNACVEDLNNKGVLYAFLVNGQNEKHFSCTLRILYGTPQEHRNMPLNNALSFVARNFEDYQKRVRDLKTIAPKPTFDPSRMPPGFIAPDDKIIYYLHLLADARMLTIEELNEVIEFVQKRIQTLANAEETMDKARLPVESMQNSMSSKNLMSINQPVRDEKVIQHQTQLHSKILNILKPIPHQTTNVSENTEMANMDSFNAYNESNNSSSKNNMIINPKVQQALDTLMQSSQFRPNVSEQNLSMEDNRNFQQQQSNNQMMNAYSMNPNMRPVNPHAVTQRTMVPVAGPGGQSFGNNFHGYYQPPLGQPIFRGRPPFPSRPQYPGY